MIAFGGMKSCRGYNLGDHEILPFFGLSYLVLQLNRNGLLIG